VIAAGLPSDGYGRGSSHRSCHQPTLFYRAGWKHMRDVAAETIDVAARISCEVKQWSSGDPDGHHGLLSARDGARSE